MATTIRQWLRAAADTLLPRLCPVCGNALASDEPWLCRHCWSQLPRTQLHNIPFNTVEQLFAGKVPIERATGYFFYEKSSPYSQILQDIKYRHTPLMGTWLAAQAARELQAAGFFDDISAIAPVPLHATKLAKRGYNQSEYIARGLSQVTHIPVVKAVKAVRAHETQTRKGALERFKNTQDTFAASRKAQALSGKHILLTDDVITTGSTLSACAQALQNDVEHLRVSIFTLAVARLSQ